MDVKDKFRTIAAMFTYNRKGFLPRSIARICQMYLTSYNNIDFEFSRNGEKLVLERLSTFFPKTIFDVGANVGEWSFIASKLFPNANIHAFEIAPPTYEILKANTSGHDKIIPHDFGLSSEAGEIEIAYFPDASTVTTSILENEVFTDGKQIIEGKVQSGDDFCLSEGIEEISYLKIDVEGAEHFVLHGFEKMLKAGKINVIQFEYGKVSLYSGFFLKDMYNLLYKYGYAIGKLYRNGVEFKDYSPIEDEDLMGPNYIACLKDKVEILNALRAQ